MNKTLTQADLSALIARLTDCPVADTETFLHVLFTNAAKRLAEEGSVEIPGVGRFIVGDSSVEFAPDPAMAKAINAPFADFQAVELPDGFGIEDITENEGTHEEPELEEPVETAQPAPETEEEEIAESAEREERLDADSDVTEESVEDTREDEPQPVVLPEATEETPNRKKSNKLLLWVCLIGIVLFIGGFLLGRSLSSSKTQEELAQTAVVKPDTIAVPVEAKPAPEPEPEQLDTISRKRFLITMARIYYGEGAYWVYIYEENAERLNHQNPDGLKVGTVVSIPPAKKYGLVAGDKEKIKEAVEKAVEIRGRFN